MRICPECHNEVADGMRFCPSCGKYMPLTGTPEPAPAVEEKTVENTVFEQAPEFSEPSAEPFVNESGFTAASIASSLSEPSPQPEEAYVPEFQQSTAPNTDFYGVPNPVNVSEEVKTPSVWSFVLTFFICSLPLVSTIYIIALACGATIYPAKKNLARAAFLYILLQLVVAIAVGIVLALTIGESGVLAIVEQVREQIPSIL